MPTRRPIPPIFWWTSYFALGIWAQESFGGLDFLTPGLLICLQSRHWWRAAWITVLWVLVQEGVGNLVFGTTILFYAGMYLFFLASRWLLEPENPLFVLFFSLFLAAWSWVVLHGAVTFQELSASAPPLVSWVARQWLAYVVFWVAASLIYRRWVGHGRV